MYHLINHGFILLPTKIYSSVLLRKHNEILVPLSGDLSISSLENLPPSLSFVFQVCKRGNDEHTTPALAVINYYKPLET